jgi:hypothetical protein
MSNALSTFHGVAVANVEDLNNRLVRGRQNIPSPVGGGDTLLRVDQNDGLFVFGPDNVEVEENSKWAVNPWSFKTGWVCWADRKMNGNKNEKLGEKMVDAANAIPEPDLPDAWADKGGKWVAQISFELFCIDGEDTGQKVLYQNSSNGAIKAYEKMYDAVLDRPNLDCYFPIVVPEVSSYMNKGYNKRIYEPVFEIVDWADVEQKLLSATGKKAKKVEAKEETSEAAEDDQADAAPEADEEQPRRRRHRTAA